MSLILDALRKMELERKARRQSPAALRTEVLNYRGNPHPNKKSLLLPVAAGLFVVAAAVASFFYFKNGSSRSEAPTAVAPAAVVAAPAPPATTQTPPPMPLALPQTLPPAAVNRKPEATGPAESASVSRKADDGSLSISGIAWQEERSLRRAVINGSLLSEGEEILGAKIIEIRENLVRFRRGGNSFEVAYPSGAGK